MTFRQHARRHLIDTQSARALEDWEHTREGQEKLKRITKAHGLPMTREEYEEKKKKLSRKHAKKDSKID